MRRQRIPRRQVEAALETLRPVCPGCGRSFLPVRPKQVHCRPGCRALAARRDGVPGSLFEVAPDA